MISVMLATNARRWRAWLRAHEGAGPQWPNQPAESHSFGGLILIHPQMFTFVTPPPKQNPPPQTVGGLFYAQRSPRRMRPANSPGAGRPSLLSPRRHAKRQEKFRNRHDDNARDGEHRPERHLRIGRQASGEQARQGQADAENSGK